MKYLNQNENGLERGRTWNEWMNEMQTSMAPVI